MLRRIRTLVALGGLIGLTLVFTPSVAAGDPCYHDYTIPPATTAATTDVRLDPCAFLPTNAQVAPGSTVTFTNKSGFTHLLMGANGAWGDRDTEIPDGGIVSVTFDEPGIYAYACALHRGMSGVIVVQEPGTDVSAAGSTTPAPGGGTALTMVAMAALAVLAIAGWGLALAQQRRRVLA